MLGGTWYWYSMGVVDTVEKYNIETGEWITFILLCS